MSLVADDATAARMAAETASAGRLDTERHHLPTVGSNSTHDAMSLVQLAQRGDLDAFGMLYCAYRGKVYHYLLRRLGNRVNAEDLVTETFIRVFNSISSFTYQGQTFGAWVMTIARNLSLDFVKSSSQRREVITSAVADTGSTDKSAEAYALDRATATHVRGYLEQLPHHQQKCLALRFLFGLSVDQTAALMGRSAGAIRQLQHRAVRKFACLVDDSELV